jgi:hypothetical protein
MRQKVRLVRVQHVGGETGKVKVKYVNGHM